MINNQNLAVLSEKVAYLEAALKTAGVLPDVSASDNGSTLQVIEGAWAKGDAIPEIVNALDSTSETAALSAAQGKALKDSIDTLYPILKGGAATDANIADLQASAIYIHTTTGGGTNYPSSGAGYLQTFVNPGNANYACQMFYSNAGVYTRKLQGGTWGSWKQLDT